MTAQRSPIPAGAAVRDTGIAMEASSQRRKRTRARTPRRWDSQSPEYFRDHELGPAQFQRLHASDAERRREVRDVAGTRRPQDLPELTARARLVRSALNARALFESLHRNLAGLSEALADFERRKRRIAGHATSPLVSRKI